MQPWARWRHELELKSLRSARSIISSRAHSRAVEVESAGSRETSRETSAARLALSATAAPAQAMPESLYDEPPGTRASGAASAGQPAGGGERAPAADESVAAVLRGGLRRNLRIIAGVALVLALLALLGQALLFDANRCEFSLDAVREDADPPGLNPTVRLTGQNSQCSGQLCHI